jgi:hypothetical protein
MSIPLFSDILQQKELKQQHSEIMNLLLFDLLRFTKLPEA